MTLNKGRYVELLIVTPGNLRPQFKPFMILSTAKLNPTSTGQILEAGSATQHCDFYCMLSYPLGIEHSYGKSPFFMGKSTVNGNFP
jgi:hypothetical protein